MKLDSKTKNRLKWPVTIIFLICWFGFFVSAIGLWPTIVSHAAVALFMAAIMFLCDLWL